MLFLSSVEGLCYFIVVSKFGSLLRLARKCWYLTLLFPKAFNSQQTWQPMLAAFRISLHNVQMFAISPVEFVAYKQKLWA